MSSLYYNCSPYRNKSLFKRRGAARGGLVRRSAAGSSSPRRAFSGRSQRPRHNNWSAFSRKASKNLVHGIARTGSAVKEGTATFQKAIQVARNIKSGKIKYEIGPAALVFGLVFVAVSLSLVYLAHFNSVATKGYELRRLEADRQQLMTQYDIKNMKLAEARSLATISQSDRASVMRVPAGVEYIQGSTALASR